MLLSLTVEVPDTLGEPLQTMRDRLPEILDRGLREVLSEHAPTVLGEAEILRVLASQPTPEQVLALQPTPAMQAMLLRVCHRRMYSSLECNVTGDHLRIFRVSGILPSGTD